MHHRLADQIGKPERSKGHWVLMSGPVDIRSG